MKILRAYTGSCVCSAVTTTHSTDGRSKNITRHCPKCGRSFLLFRDRDGDKPLKEPR